MKLNECEKESNVLSGLRSGSMPVELEAHLNSCPVCQDAKLVWSYLEGCAAAETETEIAPAGTVWWRAQLAKKRAAAQQSVAWINTMQKIAIAVSVITAIAIGAWQGPKMIEIPPMLLAGSAAALILLLASVAVVLRLERDSTLRRDI
ncbi:MAG TPA: hypothetical protein VMF91_13695 [Bryobacteraceae bacterium]|nr:hypothetical protein [Bryobacteraceae bacterium]